jgi:hypothetical protein
MKKLTFVPYLTLRGKSHIFKKHERQGPHVVNAVLLARRTYKSILVICTPVLKYVNNFRSKFSSTKTL